MEDVANACGVTKLIIYRHFETKDELYRAILQGVFDRLGEELRRGLDAGTSRGLGARVQLTVARENPDGYMLLWNHAAREPMFADYAEAARAISTEVVRQLLHLESNDAALDRWKAEVLFAWLIDATLAWLREGMASRDDEFVERTTAGLAAIRDSWRS
jgi:AcrR family transcriptional regulator